MQKYFEDFGRNGESSREKIEETYQRNSETLKNHEMELESGIYQSEKSQLQTQAQKEGLDQVDIVDKKLISTVTEMVNKESQVIQEGNRDLQAYKSNLKDHIQEKQSEIRENTGIGRFNKLDHIDESS